MIASTNEIPSSAASAKAPAGMSLPRQMPCRSAYCTRTTRTPSSLSSPMLPLRSGPVLIS